MCGLLSFDEVAILDKGNPRWVLFYRVWFLGPMMFFASLAYGLNTLDWSKPLIPDQTPAMVRATFTVAAIAAFGYFSICTLY